MEVSEERRKNKKIKIIIAVIIIIPIIIYKLFYPVEYRIFSDERKIHIESEYNIDLRGADCKRYVALGMAKDYVDAFKFAVDDSDEFMKNNYFGEIIEHYENGNISSYICRPYPDGVEPLDDFVFNIEFRNYNNKYNATLISYYD